MGAKRVSKHSAAKHDPFLQGKQNLFGDLQVDAEVLTDEQKATAFLTKYQELVDPFETYKLYFQSSAKSEAWNMKDVKLYYTQLVLSGRWSEKKYVTVINDVFENGAVFSPVTLETKGRIYEEEGLSSQRRAASSRRRGRL